MKYSQGHWKWYDWIKLNEFYHHEKFDTDRIYSVQESRNSKVFPHTLGQSAGLPNTDHYILTFFMWVKKWFNEYIKE